MVEKLVNAHTDDPLVLMAWICRFEHSMGFTCASHSVNEDSGIISLQYILNRFLHSLEEHLMIGRSLIKDFLVFIDSICFCWEVWWYDFYLALIDDRDGWRWVLRMAGLDPEVNFEVGLKREGIWLYRLVMLLFTYYFWFIEGFLHIFELVHFK